MRSVRVFFEKTGNIKYISHLDLNRFMLKLIRKSGIPVWYSEGFNPHPYITFALPLSLGFESTYEIMDIRLDNNEFTNDEVYNALNGLFPVGLTLVSCGDPVMKAGEVAFADYLIEFEEAGEEFVSNLNNFLNRDHTITKKKTKKGNYKDIDIKEFIRSYEINGNNLKLVLVAGGSNNLNPKLILDAFASEFQLTLPYYKVTRTCLFNSNMEKFI